MKNSTFFFDIDGTIVKNLSQKELEHNIFIPNYTQKLLPDVKHFFNTLDSSNIVIFTTARQKKFREMTERTLKKHNINYKHLIMDLPCGTRYVVNDTVNCFYKKAVGINLVRDQGFGSTFIYDSEF